MRIVNGCNNGSEVDETCTVPRYKYSQFLKEACLEKEECFNLFILGILLFLHVSDCLASQTSVQFTAVQN